MKLKNLLPLLAIVCSFAACSPDGNGGNGNDGPLFKEPCVQWGASKSTVKSYMKGCTLLEEEDDNFFYLLYTDIRTRNLLPYTIMYEYASETEIVYNPETMESIEVDKGIWDSSIWIIGTTKQQQEKLNEEFIAFFDEKYNEIPIPSPEEDSSVYYEDGTYKYADEDLEGEIVGAYVNDAKNVYVIVAIIKKMVGNTVNNWIIADYSYEL